METVVSNEAFAVPSPESGYGNILISLTSVGNGRLREHYRKNGPHLETDGATGIRD